MTALHRTRLAALGLALATLVAAYFTGGPPPPVAEAPPPPRRAGSEPAGPTAPPGEFRRRNPFEILRVHPPPAPPPVTPARPTSAAPPPAKDKKWDPSIELVGTVSAGAYGMAFFVDGRGREPGVVGVGDDLGAVFGERLAGVRLESVSRRRAVLRRGAARHELAVDETEGAAEPPGGAAPPAPRPPAAPPAPDSTYVAPPPGQPVELKRGEIERATRNLAFLVTQITAQPYFDRGKPAGVRLARIRPDSVFARLGVKNGDVIKGVGGKPVNTLRDTMRVLQDFQSKPSVQLDVLRAGALTSLNYKIK